MPRPGPPLDQGERLDWLRLARSENVGPITFFQLLNRFGSPGAALSALPELARRGGMRRRIRVPPAAAAAREAAALEALGGRFLMRGEAGYPAPLAAIEDAPPVLALLGHGHLLARPMVAVVGARNASGNGRRFARRLAADLGERETVVVSGLARGIDRAAHEGALGTGTVAVLAGGVDVPYPAENRDLYEEIRARGALLAEGPLGTEPRARHFPRRNRIVSGLSAGVVVVEAARRSGSLITARLALEQGREVFAVPGSPLDPRAQGTNDLIRQGATLIQSAADVVEALDAQFRTPISEPVGPGPAPPPGEPPPEEALEPARRAVLECLGPSPMAVDELVRQCHLSPALVSTVLLELELAGRVERQPGSQVSLVPEPADR